MGSTLWEMFGEEIASNASKRLKKQKIAESSVVLSVSLARVFMADAETEDVIEDEPIHTIAHAVVDSSDTKRLSYLTTYPRLGLVFCHVLHFKEKALAEEVLQFILRVRDKAQARAESTRNSLLEAVVHVSSPAEPEDKETKAIQAKIASLMGGTLAIAEVHFMGSVPVLVRKDHPCVADDIERATGLLFDTLRASPVPRRRLSFGKGKSSQIDPGVGRPVVLVVSSEGVRLVDSLSREESHRVFVKDLVFWSEVATKREKSVFSYIARDPRLNAAACHVFRCNDKAQAVRLRECVDKASRTEREVETLQKGMPFMPTSSLRHSLQKNALSLLEIPRSGLIPVRPIGAGQFGLVFHVQQRVAGDKAGAASADAVVDCAVKALRQGASQDDMADFLREAQTMSQLDHPNILRIRGVCLAQQPWLIVLDLMQYGDLDHVLRTCREKDLEVPAPVLLSFALQIARGMEHLVAHSLLHLDLAARNCLLHTCNVVKIADFGATRQLPADAKDMKLAEVLKVATRWLAIETMDHRVVSEKTDVWAYGVTCWEIFAYGQEPYSDVHFLQVQRLVREGRRLAQPPACPDPAFAMLSSCWHASPSKRPSFAALVKAFASMHDGAQAAAPGSLDVGQTLALMASTDV
jgi:hypothetical protein